MARPIANLRLFVGIYPPRELAETWVRALASVDLPPHRVTPVEQVHLTVQFIGDTPAKELDATIESVERSASGIGSFNLSPQRLIVLPERGPARLISLETDAPAALMELKNRLVVRLASNVRREAKRGREFRPHITLCRYRTPSKFAMPAIAVEPAPFSVERIALMRSTLAPDGAQHHEVLSCALIG